MKISTKLLRNIFLVILLMALSSIINASLFSVLSDEEYNVATDAIVKNDFEKFNNTLASKKDESEQYDCLLEKTLESLSSSGKRDCREKFIKLLLDKKAKIKFQSEHSYLCNMGGREVYLAIHNGCFEVVKLLIGNSEIEMVSKSIPEQWHELKIVEVYPQNEKRRREDQQLVRDGQILSLKYLTDLLKPSCEKQNGSGVVCIAFNNINKALDEDNKKVQLQESRDKQLKDMVDKQEKEATDAEEKAKAEEARQKTPEGLKETVCENYNTLKQAEELTNHEHRITKSSGIVNKKALYQFGRMKITAEDQLSKNQKEFKKLTGKIVNIKECKVTSILNQ